VYDTDRKSDITYAASENYDERLQHHTNFFNSVRTGTPVIEDAVFGYRAAAPALLCNDSYSKDSAMLWNPEKMQLITK